MIISDLNYMETAESNLQGGTAASAGSSAGALGLFVSTGTGAKTKSTSVFFGLKKTSKASTYGYASAVAGIVSSTSGAGSFA